jgi:hypothetical protein
MERLTVVKIDSDGIEFENGVKLSSHHDSDCCEHHYLSFDDLTIVDFEDLEFDLTNDNFFKRIEDYGIELIPIKGHSVKVPGYGSNNGYYSSNLSLCLSGNGIEKNYNITECKVIG